jgi:hypothetical protein
MAESTEGLPMYVESLLNIKDWKDNMSKYPSICHIKFDHAHRPKPNSMRWRDSMGSSVSKKEQENINSNLDYLKNNAGINNPVVVD